MLEVRTTGKRSRLFHLFWFAWKCSIAFFLNAFYFFALFIDLYTPYALQERP